MKRVARLVGTVAIAVGIAACHRTDKVAIRKKALAILAARRPRAVPQAPIECPPGSGMTGAEHCVLQDPERTQMANTVRFQLRMVLLSFADEATDERDEIAADIVRDPRFVGALLATLVRAHSCRALDSCKADDKAVEAVDAQIENLFAATLQVVIRGGWQDLPPRDEVWMSRSILPALTKLSDDDLTAYYDKNLGRVPHVLTKFLASYQPRARR